MIVLSHCMFVFVAMLLASGCGSSSGSSGPPPEGAIQIVNAIVDSPLLTFELTVDDEILSSPPALNFQGASGITTLPKDTYELTVRYVDPLSGTDFNLISDFEFDVDASTLHTLVLRGPFATANVFQLDKPLTDVFDDADDVEEIEVQALNLSGESTAIYLGDPNSSLSGETLLGTLAPGTNTEPTLITDEENSLYRLRITGDGNTNVLYDSGDFDIPASGRRLIVVHDNIGPDASTNNAFVVLENATSIFPNEVAHAGIRLVNAIADDTSATIEVTVPATSDVVTTATLPFPESTSFVMVDPSFVNVGVEVASSPGTTTNATVSLNEDTFFTIVVGGSGLEDAVAIQAAPTSIRPIATAANLQFINGLRTTTIEEFDRVDLYALPIGDALADAAPTLGQVGFLSSASNVLPATTVDLVVTTAGTQSILAGPIRVSLQGSTDLLVVATEAFGGGVPNQVIVHTTDLSL